MATLTTKYAVGDTVYFANTNTEQRRHPCPDCKGERNWTATSPAGSTFTFACPRCSASYQSTRELSLAYSAHAPSVRKLTIGSVRVDTAAEGSDEPVSYMCVETGVGSGNVYRESRLFETEEQAQRSAELLAAHANQSVEWIATLYNKTLEMSDYQLDSALVKAAKETESRASSMLWNVRDLFAAIEGAGDRDAILEAVQEYREWYWKSDIALVRERIEARRVETEDTGSIHESRAEGLAQTSPREIQ